MANDKKKRRQERALERLEKRIELDDFGHAKSNQISSNTFGQEHEHYNLQRRLGKIPGPSANPKHHPSSIRNYRR